jgi:hypothetical protein
MQQTSAATVSLWTAASSRRILGANERVRLGFIGVGNRGDQVLTPLSCIPMHRSFRSQMFINPIFPLRRAKQAALRSA